jgi:hypothetical protein
VPSLYFDWDAKPAWLMDREFLPKIEEICSTDEAVVWGHGKIGSTPH